MHSEPTYPLVLFWVKDCIFEKICKNSEKPPKITPNILKNVVFSVEDWSSSYWLWKWVLSIYERLLSGSIQTQKDSAQSRIPYPYDLAVLTQMPKTTDFRCFFGFFIIFQVKTPKRFFKTIFFCGKIMRWMFGNLAAGSCGLSVNDLYSPELGGKWGSEKVDSKIFSTHRSQRVLEHDLGNLQAGRVYRHIDLRKNRFERSLLVIKLGRLQNYSCVAWFSLVTAWSSLAPRRTNKSPKFKKGQKKHFACISAPHNLVKVDARVLCWLLSRNPFKWQSTTRKYDQKFFRGRRLFFGYFRARLCWSHNAILY